jgi:hypothetical protein
MKRIHHLLESWKMRIETLALGWQACSDTL